MVFKAFVKSFFSANKANAAPRAVSRPEDLRQGDFLKLNDSFALPPELRDQSFEVTDIDTYYYGQERCTEWVLKGTANKSVFFSISEIEDQDMASFSLKLKRKEVEALVGWSALKAQFKTDYDAPLEVKEIPEALQPWMSQRYLRRECAGQGEYFSGDLRDQPKPYQGGEALTYYEFYSEDEKFSFEVEQWSADEIDVFIALHRPLSDIREVWAK